MTKADLVRGFITGLFISFILAFLFTIYFFEDFAACRERNKVYEYALNQLKQDFIDYKILVNKTIGELDESAKLSKTGN